MAGRPPFVIQREGDRHVRVEADGTVTKAFAGQNAQEEANREADRLRRFRAALDGVDGATCPAVVHVDGPPWRVNMARVATFPVSSIFSRSTRAYEQARRCAEAFG